ncbi:hypothetical protein [Singulisphaera acidiphila]|uniref:Uncharacterized protein n=1 Tax=Singulisphaera acidiphila (strain ATCC BAA-1392 / DSM 18658 / VKM B-2454 / MOB10) TaxID=886293 RepID=L0DN10_SINAD|nr:hypothetical protein [Singulisphaera acidiphila]AGA30228.1 hypothetical protein Sinac_6123 [Singulisphaera acidiphila DSM 18658]
MRITASLIFALLTLAASAGFPGCGNHAVEFDKAVEQNPESLAQEFLFRYKALPDRASARQKARMAALEKAEAAVPEAVDQTKSERGETTKKVTVPTLEGLLTETEGKVAGIPGMSRTEAGKQVVEFLAKESAITPDDLRLIRERLAK